MRYVLIPCFFAFAFGASGQVNMTLYGANGKLGGSATFDIRSKGDGLLETMTLNSATTHSTLRLTTLLSASGLPIRDSVDATTQGKTIRIIAAYGPKGVTVNVTAPDGKKSKFMPYPKGARLLDLSAFWFVRHKPRVGEEDDHMSFEPETMEYRPSRNVYVGDKTIKYHGRSVLAHEIESEEDTQWLDDRGLPYKIVGKKDKAVFIRN